MKPIPVKTFSPSFKTTCFVSFLIALLLGSLLLLMTQNPALLKGEGDLASAKNASSALTLLNLAFLLAVFLYTLSLFAFKPTEKYLLDFLFLQGVILIRNLLRDFGQAPLLKEAQPWLAQAFTFALSLLMLRMSLQLSHTRLSPAARRALSFPFILLWALPCFYVGIHSIPLRHLRNLLVFISCNAVLAGGSARGERGVKWLLAGMILVLGIYLSIIGNLFLPAKNPLFREIPRTIFVDFPFLLGAMFCVNSKFALAFREKEVLSERLEEMVEERTRQIEELQEERHSMIANIFHDLRTPLFVIGNALDVLEANPASLPDMLPLLKQRSSFARELTEDLFLLIKLQDGKLVLGQQKVDLSGILTSLCGNLKEGTGRPDLCLSLEISPLLQVWGDPIRLQQIFQNLILNAVHYTPEGGQLRVKAGPETENSPFPPAAEESFCLISVSDSGPGISPEDAAHLFERYFHSDQNHKHDSSGLGLSIARELVLLHHGEITFESEAGKGTCFYVRLPLCE